MEKVYILFGDMITQIGDNILGIYTTKERA